MTVNKLATEIKPGDVLVEYVMDIKTCTFKTNHYVVTVVEKWKDTYRICWKGGSRTVHAWERTPIDE